jgi:hypothetical protein
MARTRRPRAARAPRSKPQTGYRPPAADDATPTPPVGQRFGSAVQPSAASMLAPSDTVQPPAAAPPAMTAPPTGYQAGGMGAPADAGGTPPVGFARGGVVKPIHHVLNHTRRMFGLHRMGQPEQPAPRVGYQEGGEVLPYDVDPAQYAPQAMVDQSYAQDPAQNAPEPLSVPVDTAPAPAAQYDPEFAQRLVDRARRRNMAQQPPPDETVTGESGLKPILRAAGGRLLQQAGEGIQSAVAPIGAAAQSAAGAIGGAYGSMKQSLADYVNGTNAVSADQLQAKINGTAAANPGASPAAVIQHVGTGSPDMDENAAMTAGLRKQFDIGMAIAKGADAHGHLDNSLEAVERAYDRLPDGQSLSLQRTNDGKILSMVQDANGDAVSSHVLTEEQYRHFLDNATFDHLADNGIVRHLDGAASLPAGAGVPMPRPRPEQALTTGYGAAAAAGPSSPVDFQRAREDLARAPAAAAPGAAVGAAPAAALVPRTAAAPVRPIDPRTVNDRYGTAASGYAGVPPWDPARFPHRGPNLGPPPLEGHWTSKNDHYAGQIERYGLKKAAEIYMRNEGRLELGSSFQSAPSKPTLADYQKAYREMGVISAVGGHSDEYYREQYRLNHEASLGDAIRVPLSAMNVPTGYHVIPAEDLSLGRIAVPAGTAVGTKQVTKYDAAGNPVTLNVPNVWDPSKIRYEGSGYGGSGRELFDRPPPGSAPVEPEGPPRQRGGSAFGERQPYQMSTARGTAGVPAPAGDTSPEAVASRLFPNASQAAQRSAYVANAAKEAQKEAGKTALEAERGKYKETPDQKRARQLEAIGVKEEGLAQRAAMQANSRDQRTAALTDNTWVNAVARRMNASQGQALRDIASRRSEQAQLGREFKPTETDLAVMHKAFETATLEGIDFSQKGPPARAGILPPRQGASAAPAAPAAPAQQPAPAAAAPTATIPAGAIQLLKSNPALRDKFDQQFGAGSAARILGP